MIPFHAWKLTYPFVPDYSYYGRLHSQVVKPVPVALCLSTAPAKVWFSDCPLG